MEKQSSTSTTSIRRTTTMTAVNRKDFDAGPYLKTGMALNKLNSYMRFFDHLDRDGSRGLNPKEFTEIMTGLGLKFKSKDIYRLFGQFDVNMDGLLNFKEFLDMVLAPNSSNQYLKELQKATKQLVDSNKLPELKKKNSEQEEKQLDISTLQKEKVDKYKKAFEIFDDDNSGLINPRELLEVLAELDHSLSNDEIYLMISELDYDGDGSIGLNEFVSQMINKEGSLPLRTMRVGVKELLEGKKKRKINRRLFLVPKRKYDVSKYITEKISAVDAEDIAKAFDALDFEGVGKISIKRLKERKQDIEKKIEESKNIFEKLLALSSDLEFDQFYQFIINNGIQIKDIVKVSNKIGN